MSIPTPLAIRETMRAGIKIIIRVNGGKEFIQPVARNFREKIQSTVFLVIFTAIFVGFILFAREFMRAVPYAWAKFLLVNFFFMPFAILGLVAGVLGIACGDIWLRSSRVVATSRELQVVTRWLFVNRKVTVATGQIIQTKAANNTTINDVRYFDIEVRATGEKPFWLYQLFPPKKELDEIEMKRIRTGGKAIRILTEIQGEEDAQFILSELRSALDVRV